MSSATVVSQNLRSLIGYIVNKHHVYLRQELPRLEAIIGKMSRQPRSGSAGAVYNPATPSGSEG